MTSKALRLIYLLMVPGGLILAAGVAVAVFYHLPPTAAEILPWLPYSVFAIGILLSLRFNCGRVLWTMILLALVQAFLSFYVIGRPALAGHQATILLCISALLPMNLVMLAMTPERGATRAVGGTLLTGIVLQAAAVFALCTPQLASTANLLRTSLVDWSVLRTSQLPQLALISFVLSTTVLAIHFLQSRRPIDGGIFWTAIVLFLILNRPTTPPLLGLYSMIAGLILIASLIEMSYHLAFLDELTGLPGRRAFNDATARLGWNYTLAMVDVDHFKKFNDTYGHDCGDQVLRLVAAKLATAPGKAQAFRYGGEEFALIFPGKTAKQTINHLEDLREEIAKSKFTVRAPAKKKKKSANNGKPKSARTSVQITVSIGAANYDSRNNLVEKVLVAADKALYRAKDAGRNCVKCASASANS